MGTFLLLAAGLGTALGVAFLVLRKNILTGTWTDDPIYTNGYRFAGIFTSPKTDVYTLELIALEVVGGPLYAVGQEVYQLGTIPGGIVADLSIVPGNFGTGPPPILFVYPAGLGFHTLVLQARVLDSSLLVVDTVETTVQYEYIGS